MGAPNDEGPVLATPTLQEQTTTDTAIVADTGTAGKLRHPLSEAFGDMPADEFAELKKDIKKNGQISDIVKAEDGRILDGWHRYRACVEAGVKPRIEPFSYIVEAASEVAGRRMTEAEFVVAQNAHRRHLTAEQRRRIVGELLKADPAKSDRAIAGMVKVDHKTVAAVRSQAEAGGEIPHLTKTTGSDGKKYTKPAGKPAAPATDPVPQNSAEGVEAPAKVTKPRGSAYVSGTTAKVRDHSVAALRAGAKASRDAAWFIGANSIKVKALERTRDKLHAAIVVLNDLLAGAEVSE